VPCREIDASTLASKIIAVDTPNVIYRHLFQIRDSTGSPYRNQDGAMIGHLIGLCNEIAVLYEARLRPIFVFDGETPLLKAETMRKRSVQAAQRGFRLDSSMKDQMKRALDALGVPWVQAPEEAEAQASYMTKRGCWAALTNDYDALLFGASCMIRHLSKGRAEVCVLSEALESLGLDRGRLIDLALLMGTDYNPGGVRGLGPKRSLQLIRTCSTAKAVLAEIGQNGEMERKLSEIRSYYLDPPVAGSWRSSWEPPDLAEAQAYLVREMRLSEASVGRLIRVMTCPILPGPRQTKLDC